MPQTMYRDDRDLGPVAVPFQNIVNSGIVGVFLEHENRLIFRNVFYQCCELNHRLPVNLNFTDRRFIFCWQKSAVSFIIPRFIDGQHAFFKRLGKRLDAHVADKLLRDGRVRLKDCKSAKGKTYNATVLLGTEPDGRSKFSLEFEGGF